MIFCQFSLFVLFLVPALCSISSEASNTKPLLKREREKETIQKSTKKLKLVELDDDDDIFTKIMNLVKRNDHKALAHVLDDNKDPLLSFDNSLLLSCQTDRFKCARVLIEDGRCDVTVGHNLCFWRALKLRNFRLLSTLIRHESIQTQHMLMKEAFIQLVHLTYSPKYVNTNDQQTIMGLWKEICAQELFNKFALDILLALKYTFGRGRPREIVKMCPADTDRIKVIRMALIPRFLLYCFPDWKSSLVCLVDNFGLDSLYSRLIYYVGYGLLRKFHENSPGYQRFLTDRSKPFYDQVISEPLVPSNAVLHVEERFWVNCMFDNYMHLLPNSAPFEGSVIVDQSDAKNLTLLFPSYTRFYLEHFESILPRLRVETEEERQSLVRFRGYLLNLVESSERYFDEERKELVRRRIRDLQPGEEYALDIYARLTGSLGQGHLVLGIISVSAQSQGKSKLYDMRIINTGAKGFHAFRLETRFRIYVDQKEIPLDILLEHYIPIIESISYTAIYLAEYCEPLSSGQFCSVLHKPRDLPDAEIPNFPFEHTIRGQQGPTCSTERLHALGKLTCGLHLYMEFKTRFFLGFVQKDLVRIARETWNSPQISLWMLVKNSPLFERNLLRPLERIGESSRFSVLKQAILSSVNDRYGTDRFDLL